METQNKQSYSAPRLVEYGRVEDITRGPSGGFIDWFFGGTVSGYQPPHGGHTSS
jgi:hypothetical protein